MQSISAQSGSRQADAHLRPAGVSFWRMFSVHALLDEEGRPLGEHRAPPGLNEETAPTRLRQCRYAGSRYNHRLPMNASALRQTSRHWDDIAAGIVFLRCGFRDSQSELTLRSCGGCLRPWRYFLRTFCIGAEPSLGPWVPEASWPRSTRRLWASNTCWSRTSFTNSGGSIGASSDRCP